MRDRGRTGELDLDVVPMPRGGGGDTPSTRDRRPRGGGGSPDASTGEWELATKKGKPKGPPAGEPDADPTRLSYGPPRAGLRDVIFPDWPWTLWFTPSRDGGLAVWTLGGMAIAAVQVALAWALFVSSTGFGERFLASVLTLALGAGVTIGASWYWGNLTWQVADSGRYKPRNYRTCSRLVIGAGLVTSLGLTIAIWGAWTVAGVILVVGWSLGMVRLMRGFSEAARINRKMVLRGPKPMENDEIIKAKIKRLWLQMVDPPDVVDPVSGKVKAKGAKHPLSGSQITVVTELLPRTKEDRASGAHPFRARVRLPGSGVTNWQTLNARAVEIAKTYGTQAAYVFAAPYRFETHAELTVYTQDPLADVVRWKGPTMTDSGRLVVARLADGTEARMSLWDGKDGANHGLIHGDTGSGKSSPGKLMLVEAMLSRRMMTCFLDPTMGASIEGMKDRVDFFAGGDDIPAALEAIDRLVMSWMGSGRINFAPTPAKPGLLVLFDESHRILRENKAVTTGLAKTVAIARKTNVGFVLVNQHPGLEQVGGDGSLRGNLLSGNGFLHRIADMGAKQIAKGTVWENFQRFPRGAARGVAFMSGAGEAVSPLLGRIAFIDGWGLVDTLDAKRGPRTIDPAAAEILADFRVHRETANV